MKKQNVEQIAKQDAERWLSAEMFYGDGAGVRRRHLDAEITDKALTLDGYVEAFDQFYRALDKTKFAEKAIKERKRIDRGLQVSKNFRALKAGKLHQLSTGVYVVVGVAYVAHVTGYDKKVEAEAKKLYRKAKMEIKFRKAKREGRNVEKLY